MGMLRKEEIMSEEEKKFLEIVDLKKGFGSKGRVLRAARTVRLREIDAAQYHRRH